MKTNPDTVERRWDKKVGYLSSFSMYHPIIVHNLIQKNRLWNYYEKYIPKKRYVLKRPSYITDYVAIYQHLTFVHVVVVKRILKNLKPCNWYLLSLWLIVRLTFLKYDNAVVMHDITLSLTKWIIQAFHLLIQYTTNIHMTQQ